MYDVLGENGRKEAPTRVHTYSRNIHENNYIENCADGFGSIHGRWLLKLYTNMNIASSTGVLCIYFIKEIIVRKSMDVV